MDGSFRWARRSTMRPSDFLAVGRSGNFSGAARELGISGSAVSQSIRQLEEELRVTLVARTLILPVLPTFRER